MTHIGYVTAAYGVVIVGIGIFCLSIVFRRKGVESKIAELERDLAELEKPSGGGSR